MSFFLDTFTGAIAYLGAHTPDTGGTQWVAADEVAFSKYVELDGSGNVFGVWSGSGAEPTYTSTFTTSLPIGGVKITLIGQQDTPSAAQSWEVAVGVVAVSMNMDPAHLFARNSVTLSMTGVGNFLSAGNLDVSSAPYTIELICADGFQQITFNGVIVGSAAASYGGSVPDATSLSLNLAGDVSGSGNYNTLTSLALDVYAPAPFWTDYVKTVEADA